MSKNYEDVGRFSVHLAETKTPAHEMTRSAANSLTRRASWAEFYPGLSRSTSLAAARVKALRLFTHICRTMPYIIRISHVMGRVTPVQAKTYVSNWFREHSQEKDLQRIDYLIEMGYSSHMEIENQYSLPNHIYKYIMPRTHKYRDFAVDRFHEKKADRINQAPSSGFLESFYRGSKPHTL